MRRILYRNVFCRHHYDHVLSVFCLLSRVVTRVLLFHLKSTRPRAEMMNAALARGLNLKRVSTCLLSSGKGNAFPLPWREDRAIHITAGRLANEPATFDGEIFESSAQAKWAADAASMADQLPPQGDLASLGLGGYSPVGLLQTGIEWLHVNAGLPWWGAIIVSSLVLRVVLFPLAVKLQVNAANLNNIRPQTDKIMAKMKEYQQTGNANMAAQEGARLMMLYQKHNCNPIKMMIMPFVQVRELLPFTIRSLFLGKCGF